MYNNKILNELSRLDFEFFLWLFYGVTVASNIFGNYYEKEYVKTNHKAYRIRADQIYTIIFLLTFLIYIYIFIRNYRDYKKAPPDEKKIYLIRLLGSSFLIDAVICLIYFQINHSSLD